MATGQLLSARALQQAGIFAAGVLIARDAGPRTYGLYSAAFALASVVVGGTTSGLPVLVLRTAAEDGLRRRTLRLMLRAQAGLSALAVAVTSLIGLVALGGPGGFRAAAAAGLAFTAFSVALMGANVQSGNGRFGRAAASDATSGLLFPLVTYAAIRAHLGVGGALAALALAGLAAIIPAWTHMPPLSPAQPGPALRLRAAVPFVALGALNAGYGRIDTVILEVVARRATVGYYAAAYRLMGPLNLLGSAFGTVYFARLSGRGGSLVAWDATRRRGAILFGAVSISAIAALEAAIPMLVRLLYGTQYAPSVGPARILILSVLPWCLYWPQANALNAAHLERRFAAMLAIGLTVDAAVVAIVGHRFGATGAAWAWVVSETVTLIGVSLAGRGMSRHWARNSTTHEGFG